MMKPLPTYQLNRIRYAFYFALFYYVFLLQISFSQTRIVVNPGLEFGIPDRGYSMLDANFGYGPTFEPGIPVTSPWYTSHPSRPNGCTGTTNGNCHPIEVWGHNFQNVPAAQGRNFVELNAYVSSMIYQDLYLVNGDVISYYYRHRARTLTSERAEMIIEDQNQADLGTIHTTSIPANTRAWSINQGNYTFNGADGIYRIGFRAIESPGQNSAVGNLLDDIRITLKPFIDLKYSEPTSSCNQQNNGSLFLRINGAVQRNTRVAVELINPQNGVTAANPNDIRLTPVTNSNGTASITNTAGTNIFLITIPPGNYDGAIYPGYSSPTNDEDGVRINIRSLVSNNTNLPAKTYRFQIKEQGSNRSTTNFDSTKYPDFNDRYYPTTEDYFINNCVCYNDPNTTNAGTDSNIGISSLRKSKINHRTQNSWPMIRKSANMVLESNTKGFVITRLTTAQVNALVSPQEGMIVYDTNLKCLKIYNGNAWQCFNSPACP